MNTPEVHIENESSPRPSPEKRLKELSSDAQLLGILKFTDEKTETSIRDYVGQNQPSGKKMSFDEWQTAPARAGFQNLRKGDENPVRQALYEVIEHHAQGKTRGFDGVRLLLQRRRSLIKLLPREQISELKDWLGKRGIDEEGLEKKTVGELADLLASKIADGGLETWGTKMLENWTKLHAPGSHSPPRRQAADSIFAGVTRDDLEMATRMEHIKPLFGLVRNALSEQKRTTS